MLLALVCAAAQAAAVKAKFVTVKGDVKARASASASWQAVKAGDAVAEGAQVKSGANSEATIGWGNGNVLKVKALSQITVTGFSSAGGSSTSNVTLDSGKVYAKAGKLSKGSSFQVKTPTAVAGVRGTDFECSETSVAVVEGTVTVSAGGVDVDLTQGMMTEIPEVGAAPEPPAAIPAETLQELNETRQEVGEISVQIETETKTESEGAAGETKTEATTEQTSEETSAAVEDTINTTMDNTVNNDLVDQATKSGEFEPGNGGLIGIIDVQVTQP